MFVIHEIIKSELQNLKTDIKIIISGCSSGSSSSNQGEEGLVKAFYLEKTIKNKKAEEDDCECIVCGKFYSNSRAGEDWIQCSRCAKGAHKLCTLGIEDVPLYTCDLCI